MPKLWGLESLVLSTLKNQHQKKKKPTLGYILVQQQHEMF